MCPRCQKRPVSDGFCKVCLWELAAEAAHAYDVARKNHKASDAYRVALGRLGWMYVDPENATGTDERPPWHRGLAP